MCTRTLGTDRSKLGPETLDPALRHLVQSSPLPLDSKSLRPTRGGQRLLSLTLGPLGRSRSLSHELRFFGRDGEPSLHLHTKEIIEV